MVFNDGFCEIPFKESLKVPKVYSKSVNRGRTDTTLAKRKKRTKDQITINKTLRIKQEMGKHDPH